MILFALSAFLSAFLLFQVQPLMARALLPYFGGTPAVWTATQLFFEIGLAAGYAYAAALERWLSPRAQARLHGPVLVLALGALLAQAAAWPAPLTPGAQDLPASGAAPLFDILLVLLLSAGLPYLLLSTNSPLSQAWFHRALPGRSPYWLYALSNAGSLLGLLAYPFFIEPNLSLWGQGWTWAIGFLLYAALAAWAAHRAARAPAAQPAASAPTALAPLPGAQVQRLWVLLSATGTILLLAITNQITQEVAAVPFLWVLPLSVYLLVFILAYSGEQGYHRGLFGVLLILASAGFIWALSAPQSNFIAQVAVYLFLLFVCVMICTGETYRLRPAPNHLTRFYLLTSAGGALGGLAVNLAAPLFFKGFWELPLSIGLVWTISLALWAARKYSPEARTRFLHHILVGASVLLIAALGGLALLGGNATGASFEERNFYGVVRVQPTAPGGSAWAGYQVVHGITVHGMQFSAPDLRRLPTVYYSETGGAGLALLNHPAYGHGMRVAVLGLGIGTLAAYGQPGDSYAFYEINPTMIHLAQGLGGFFSYLADSPAQVTVVPGDARLSLERELRNGQPRRFDYLVLDVFSSDSIPVHLVTSEAFAVYLQHLAPGGILAANISNRYLDLVPVFWQQARHAGLSMLVLPADGDGQRSYASQWVLLAREPSALQSPSLQARALQLENYTTSVPLWTDNFSNLFQILK